IIAALFIGFFAACNKFEYSPHQTELADMPSDLNNKNIQRLLGNDSGDDTVTIIYTGDSQRFYDRLSDLVSKVNTIPNVDFFIICGDIADFGLAQEYMWIHKRLEKLRVPYMCVIGNHDLASDNGEVFTKMFGEKNFSFSYRGYKFLFHDTNGREYNFNGTVPDTSWMESQFADPLPEWFVGVSHVPPYDVDFDNVVEYSYKTLLASKPNFILSLHGHLHNAGDNYYYGDGVRYMTSNSVDKDEVVMLQFMNGKVIKKMIEY
ncbi:MAG: metallophosphoesterase, partial [Bacteroidetes bacterium]|nr:metallophosphoesterase [Bacteroidota bacterium]